MNIEKIVSQMSLREKISFCTGADFWCTRQMEQYGIPSIMMADGPHGLRCQKGETDMVGVNKSLPATCFPTAVTAGATWNPELYAAEGEAIGREALAAGVSVVLGPGCNIKRNPLGGRNFEYISEDPYQAGKMAAAFIRGQQSTGAFSSLKHFAANSQEYKRMNGDSQMDERTLREIYLAAFEIAVNEGHPGTLMCAYNKINGEHCSDSKKLLTDILRSDWGFDGMVVTDWGALNDRIKGFQTGCDLNMPGGSDYMEQEAMEAVKNGVLSEADIDVSVKRILRMVEKAQQAKASDVDWDAHHALAQKVAQQGAVLLKNEDGILPLQALDVVLIGHMAKEIRYQGSGSSHINPTRLVNLTDALPEVPFVPCCDAQGNVSEEGIREAVKAAQAQKIAVVVAGLPDAYESEALDREHMDLPEGHNRMIEAVAAANPNTVVVLLGGSAMELPWADKVKAILYMGLPGQAGGEAMANLLTGKANPCGKLTETWPLSYSDVISKDTFGQRNTEYREGIYVGYRYYDKAVKAVRYPFGYGLSYTAFTYSDLSVVGRTVSVNITNTGTVKGAEVVQLYIAPPKDGLFRPEKELKGFARVELEPGETKAVTFTLDDRSETEIIEAPLSAIDSAAIVWYTTVTLCTAYQLQYKLIKPGPLARSRVTTVTVDFSPTGQYVTTTGFVGVFYFPTKSKCHRVIFSFFYGGNCYGKPIPPQSVPFVCRCAGSFRENRRKSVAGQHYRQHGAFSAQAVCGHRRTLRGNGQRCRPLRVRCVQQYHRHHRRKIFRQGFRPGASLRP